ncbi:MAG: DUF2800 domain-containing protein [Selenomonadaceae bacterium]|nr:DUF2800 domain-containing protein [Selenomonadaceae bacterium]
MLGASKFKELVGEFVRKAQGKPTLVAADDTRQDFNGAVADQRCLCDHSRLNRSRHA